MKISKVSILITSISLITFVILVVSNNPDYKQQIQDTVNYFPSYNPFNPPIKPKYTVSNESDLSLTKSILDSKSKLIISEIKISSGQIRKVITYLPPQYDPSIAYPLLVMLHGSPGKETDWVEVGNAGKTLDDQINTKSIKPLIVVFPDGNGGMERDTQFIDSTDGTEKNLTFITTNLIKTIEANYKIKPGVSNRAIGGLSSGGFGALNIGLQNQDKFGSILSFSGYGNIEQNDQSKKLIQGSQKTIDNNSPLSYIPNLKINTTSIWMVSGLQDGLNPESKKLYQLLYANHFDITLNEFDGIHSWSFWSDNLKLGLQWLNNKLD
jgi:enterochelin esterase-like enzyme